jgi:hypothetical protein
VKLLFKIPRNSTDFNANSHETSEVKTSGGILYRRNSVDTLDTNTLAGWVFIIAAAVTVYFRAADGGSGGGEVRK